MICLNLVRLLKNLKVGKINEQEEIVGTMKD